MFIRSLVNEYLEMNGSVYNESLEPRIQGILLNIIFIQLLCTYVHMYLVHYISRTNEGEGRGVYSEGAQP